MPYPVLSKLLRPCQRFNTDILCCRYYQSDRGFEACLHGTGAVRADFRDDGNRLVRVNFSAIRCSSDLTSRTSATNCARIYNSGNTNVTLLPTGWSKSFVLTVEDMWNGFYVHCLLQNAERYGYLLEVPHAASSTFTRINSALYKANVLRAGHLQPHWNHVCDKCCWIDRDAGDAFSKGIRPLCLSELVLTGIGYIRSTPVRRC